MDKDTTVKPLLTIFNIKSSSRLLVGENFTLKDLQRRCEYKYNFKTTPYASFLVIKSKSSSLRYIVFQKKATSQFIHVNTTGTKNFREHHLSVQHLGTLFNCQSDTIPCTFDNISGSCNSVCIFMQKKNISTVSLAKIASVLQAAACDCEIRFNPEVYACVVISYKGNSLLFYSSGKLSLVGFSSLDSMINASKWVSKRLIDAVTKILL